VFFRFKNRVKFLYLPVVMMTAVTLLSSFWFWFSYMLW